MLTLCSQHTHACTHTHARARAHTHTHTHTHTMALLCHHNLSKYVRTHDLLFKKTLTSCRCVNLKEWEEAQAKYPHFADEKRLSIFLNTRIKGKDGIVKPFRDYCQAALDSAGKSQSMPKHSVQWKNSTGNLIEKPYFEATKEDVLEAVPTFQGSSLIVLGNIAQVRIYICTSCTFLNSPKIPWCSWPNPSSAMLF